MDIVHSKNGVPIRFTNERWKHITLGHPEMADYYFKILETVEIPDGIYAGKEGAKIAVKRFMESFNKFIVVIYKEENEEDGFIITAYFSSRINEIKKRTLLWKP